MMKFVIFVAFITLTRATSNWDGLNVSIAMIEYQAIDDYTLTSENKIVANTASYIGQLKLLQLIQNLDIIIFPEYGLRVDNSTAVELTISENPCDKDSYEQFVRDLSCAARTTNTYVVVNLVQKVKCTTEDESPNCQTYGSLLYNTNVVFDRNGTIVALYHKYNLFGEDHLDKPPVPEEVTFETDLGLKFGIFTGFDILFKNPTQNLVAKNVDGIIYPTQWYSELPFLTALQVQQMWHLTHNVALFTAGAHNPKLGCGGSSYFYDTPLEWGWGTVISGYEGSFNLQCNKRANQRLSTDMMNNQGRNMDKFYLRSDPSIKGYTSIILNTAEENVTEDICHHGEDGNICCNFSITTTTNSSNSTKNAYTYHLVAFAGKRSFTEFFNGGLEVCAVIACLSSSLSSCGQRFANHDEIEWPITFEEITITANFEVSKNKTQYPSSLLSSIRPIAIQETIWTTNEFISTDGKKMFQRTFALKEPQDRLLTFAIYGRNFGLDSYNSVEARSLNWLLLIFPSVFVLFKSMM